MDKYKSKAELWSKDEKYRERSRSPQEKKHDYNDSSRDYKTTSPSDQRSSHHREEHHRRRRRSRERSSSSSEDESAVKHKIKDRKAPAPTTISKVSMNLKSKAAKTGCSSIQLKLNAPAKPSVVPVVKKTVASAFNEDSDDEVEEMPAECKMRMRNIGKNTPTSSGPNSFGKTKIGFVDSKKIFEKKMQQMLKDLGE